MVKPLDYIPYSKEIAESTLEKEYGWRPYPQKHFESRFTKFFEGYWLPTRFGYDTRRPQFSSLITTGQMLRKEAIERLKHPAYNQETIEEEFNYIASKLRITPEELKEYHQMPLRTYKDYRNQEFLFKIGSFTLKTLGIERNVKR